MTEISYELGSKRPEAPDAAFVDRLRSAVESVDPTIDIVIYSGKQDASQQYGSPRHNSGFTSDVYLEKGGVRLETGTPEHLAVWSALPAFGFNELGVGMARGGLHVGYNSGPPAAWGYPGANKATLNSRYPEYVQALQRALGVDIDGVYGDITRAALAGIDPNNPALGTTAFAQSRSIPAGSPADWAGYGVDPVTGVVARGPELGRDFFGLPGMNTAMLPDPSAPVPPASIPYVPGGPMPGPAYDPLSSIRASPVGAATLATLTATATGSSKSPSGAGNAMAAAAPDWWNADVPLPTPRPDRSVDIPLPTARPERSVDIPLPTPRPDIAANVPLPTPNPRRDMAGPSIAPLSPVVTGSARPATSASPGTVTMGNPLQLAAPTFAPGAPDFARSTVPDFNFATAPTPLGDMAWDMAFSPEARPSQRDGASYPAPYSGPAGTPTLMHDIPGPLVRQDDGFTPTPFVPNFASAGPRGDVSMAQSPEARPSIRGGSPGFDWAGPPSPMISEMALKALDAIGGLFGSAPATASGAMSPNQRPVSQDEFNRRFDGMMNYAPTPISLTDFNTRFDAGSSGGSSGGYSYNAGGGNAYSEPFGSFTGSGSDSAAYSGPHSYNTGGGSDPFGIDAAVGASYNPLGAAPSSGSQQTTQPSRSASSSASYTAPNAQPSRSTTTASARSGEQDPEARTFYDPLSSIKAPTVPGAALAPLPGVTFLSPQPPAGFKPTPVVAPIPAAPKPVVAPKAVPAASVPVPTSSPARSSASSLFSGVKGTGAANILSSLGISPNIIGIGANAVQSAISGSAPAGSVAFANPGNLPSNISNAYSVSLGNGMSMNSYDIGGNTVTYGTYQDASGTSVPAGTTVLCTHFMRKGWLPRELWEADTAYAKTLPRKVRRLYWRWAIPAVRRIRAGDTRLEMLLWPIVAGWARYAGWRMGAVKRRPWFGTLVHHVCSSSIWSRAMAAALKA